MKLSWREKEISVREMGDGPAVVLLHGYPLDGAMWSGVSRMMAPRFRVLKPDLPGRGDNSSPPEGSMDAYADFVAALLDALPEPAGLAGFSMGGYVALALMARRPERVGKLALVDTRATADDEAGRAARNAAIELVRSKGVEAIAEGMIPKLLSAEAAQDRERTERVRRIILRQSPETVAADLAAMRDRRDSSELLGGIRVPVLVLVGEEDVLTPPAAAEEMARRIPNADLQRIPGAGHLAPMEKPRAVATALADFFARP